MPPVPMPHFQIDLSGMDALLREFDRPALLEAFRRGALAGGEHIRGVWTKVAQVLDIRHTGAYIRGIAADGIVREAEDSNPNVDADTWEIVIEVVNTAPHASIVEDGHEAFHLPSRINWSGPRVKRSKKGVPYLSIPLRHTAYAGASEREAGGYTTHAIKAMMPEHIYQEARRLAYTHRLGVGPIHAPNGQFIAADRYRWGGRLVRPHTGPRFIMGGPGASAGGPREPGYEEHRSQRQVGRQADGTPMVNPAWQGSKYGGMFKSGSTGHSQYMTIRTITPNSTGWNIPAQRGLHVARSVASMVQSDGELQAVVMAGITGALDGAST